MKDKLKKYNEDKIPTGGVPCPVFMFRDWSFHCNNGKVIEIYQDRGDENKLRCITIDDSTGECIISVD